MLDNQLKTLLVTQMKAVLTSNGRSYPVIEQQQPTQQGINTEPTVYYQRLFDTEYGWPIVVDSENTVPPPGVQNPGFTEAESQCVETSFQIGALIIQDPSNLTLPTPADIVSLLKMGLNSRVIMAAFQQAGVYVLRVQTIEHPYFTDDRQLIESAPTLTLVLRHQRQYSTFIPGVTQVTPELIEGF